jgi:hypothetical protein
MLLVFQLDMYAPVAAHISTENLSTNLILKLFLPIKNPRLLKSLMAPKEKEKAP